MSDLLFCPFCGGEAHMDIWLHPVGERYSVMCCTCFCETYRYTTEAEAIAAWNTRVDYHGYDQAAIEAWESIKAWNSRAERTCECIVCAYFENKSTCGAYCNYFDRELGDDYDGGCTWGVLSGCKVVGE